MTANICMFIIGFACAMIMKSVFYSVLEWAGILTIEEEHVFIDEDGVETVIDVNGKNKKEKKEKE